MNFGFISPKLKHLLLFAVIACFFSSIQFLFLSKLETNFLKIDLMVIFMAYVAVEHFLPTAVVLIFLSASLLHSTSLAPIGFFYVYGLVILTISNLISKFVILGNTSTQFLSLSFLIFLKYFFGAVLFWSQGHNEFFTDFMSLQIPSFISTTVFSTLVITALSHIDNLFSVSLFSGRNSQEIVR
jgi:hypothetical protein